MVFFIRFSHHSVCVCNNSRWNLLNDLDQVVGRLAASQHADFAVY